MNTLEYRDKNYDSWWKYYLSVYSHTRSLSRSLRVQIVGGKFITLGWSRFGSRHDGCARHVCSVRSRSHFLMLSWEYNLCHSFIYHKKITRKQKHLTRASRSNTGTHTWILLMRWFHFVPLVSTLDTDVMWQMDLICLNVTSTIDSRERTRFGICFVRKPQHCWVHRRLQIFSTRAHQKRGCISRPRMCIRSAALCFVRVYSRQK